MKRDDTNLFSLICPHCKQTAEVLRVDAFEKQQLLLLRCSECDKYITSKQIDAAYKEYLNV